MKRNRLFFWLKVCLIGAALCGLAACGWLLPGVGGTIVAAYPEFSGWFWPWLIFLWCAAMPCFGVLACGWRMVSQMARGQVFTRENAALLGWVSRLAAFAGGFLLAGNLVLFLLSMSHPSVVLALLVGSFACGAVALAVEALARFWREAARLQEENALTI